MNAGNKNKNQGAADYIKYSGIAFQMIATILIMTFAGRWLDSKEWFNFPLFTVIGVLVGVSVALYLILKKV
jgi:ATP synthase protein I